MSPMMMLTPRSWWGVLAPGPPPHGFLWTWTNQLPSCVSVSYSARPGARQSPDRMCDAFAALLPVESLNAALKFGGVSISIHCHFSCCCYPQSTGWICTLRTLVYTKWCSFALKCRFSPNTAPSINAKKGNFGVCSAFPCFCRWKQ